VLGPFLGKIGVVGDHLWVHYGRLGCNSRQDFAIPQGYCYAFLSQTARRDRALGGRQADDVQSERMSEWKKAPPKRGPKPDLLKIEGDRQDAVKRTLEKKKPAAGWPKDR
jgi:hypothetical protein